MGYREYRYHSTLCMYSLNSGGNILSLSLQVPVMPIKLFWRMHNALRSESERVQFTKELYMLGLACGQIQPIMHFPGKQSSLKGRFRPHQ